MKKGHSLWETAHDDTCRLLYPDYQTLCAAFPNRTKNALVARCSRLKITRRCRILTEEEDRRFRKLYRTGTTKELYGAFPDMTATQLQRFGARRGLRRPRVRYLPTGDKLLDELREECWRLGITMGDLDEYAHANGYFRRHIWSRQAIRYDLVLRGIKELGGTIVLDRVQWPT